MKLAIGIAIGLVVLAAIPAQAVEYQPGSQIIVNEPNPTFGSSISFTEIFPREAMGGGHTPQYPVQPNTQIMCYQNSILVSVFWMNYLKDTVTPIGDGFRQAVTYSGVLGGPTQSAFGFLNWESGEAQCRAYLYSTYMQHQEQYQIIWVILDFNVGA
jgi:hypothetical protein